MLDLEVSPVHHSHTEAMRTPEQYARMEHSTPYCYALGAAPQLQYVGVHHTFDPHDGIFSIITGALRTRKPDLVLVEGVQSIHGPAGLEKMIASLSHQTAAKRGGEAVYTIKEAVALRIPWACPEPDDHDLYRALTHNYFTADEMHAWYVLSLIPQYHARGETMNFSGYAAPFLAQFKAATAWEKFDYSVEQALRQAAAIVGREINIQNIEHNSELTDPIPWPHRWEQQTILNEMSRVALQYRDRVIATNVLNELQAGKRVVVVYGAGHAVMQEPVYKRYFE